jgi:CDP-glucose 4,6-dehydratase
VEQRQCELEDLGMTPGFWKGRRVFLTGHTGFKGSWLSLLLLELGAEVHGFALAPDSQPSLFEEAGLAARMDSCIGDIRDAAALEQAMAAARPEIVLHLAAQAIVSTSYHQPVETFASNVMGTAHLLEAVRKVPGICAVVVVTSDKCYDNHETGQAYREDEPLGGKDPYSASKACTEILVASWRQSFFAGSGMPVIATARAGNVIGGGDWSADRLVPDTIRAFTARVPVQLRNPDAVRPWQHVLEPLFGYLLLAERCAVAGAFSEAWNFGPSPADARSVRDVVTALAAVWGEGASWQQQGSNPVKEAHLLRLDSSKAQNTLGWQPATDVDAALRLVADWYRRHHCGESAWALTREQIRHYFNLQGVSLPAAIEGA